MQTFSNMQRSISHKKNIKNIFLYVLIFTLYQSLSSIYLFLPPLFGILFIFFIQALNKQDNISILFISLCLVIFEAEKGYILFSSIIFLLVAYKFILPKIKQSFNCYSCIKFTYILLAYLGFLVTNTLFENIFLIDLPDANYYIVYYIVIEFFIASLL